MRKLDDVALTASPYPEVIGSRTRQYRDLEREIAVNEQLLYDVGNQKHSEDVRRAETNAGLSSVSSRMDNPVRHRVAILLVALATRVQPDLRCELPTPIRVATA